MKLKVLASSSKGNCYILQSPTGSLLLETGLPWKQIQKGLDFDLSGIVACLVTHGHGDHIKSARDVLRAGIDVWLSEGAMHNMPEGKSSDYRLPYLTESGHQFNVGDFTILAFATEHDVLDSLGFFIQYRPTGERLLFATDTFYLRNKFAGMNYVCIECNYCKDILDRNIESGLIDEGMKRRLLESHMSLDHCKDFLKANDLGQCREIILLHLSEGNSNAARMVREINELTGINTVVAVPGLEVELELYPY
jgi:phosphoribosyl 1,2-cyclic phosphodiesterase